MNTPERLLGLPIKHWLIALVLVKLVIGGIYSFATPLFEASDEVWHYPVVREIAEGRGLPVQDPVIEQLWEQEGSQPPLYYALMALVTFWVDGRDFDEAVVRNPFVKAGIPGTEDNVNMVLHRPGEGPWQGGTWLAGYVARWVSVALGGLTMLLAWQLVITLYPQRPDLALLTAALVGFTPMVLFINASVNNDNLLMPLTTLGLWLMVRETQADESAEGGWRWRDTLILGLMLGAIALTKVSGLVLLPAAALAVTFTCWRRREWWPWFGRGAALIGLVLAVSGWWYWRNVVLYGDLLGTSVLADKVGLRAPGFGLLDLIPEWGSFWYSYWGVFGVFNVLAPAWFYWLANGLSLLALAGLGFILVRWAIRRRVTPTWRSHIILLLVIGLTFVSLLFWSLQTWAMQGRLMFGVLTPIMLYVAGGLLAFWPHRWRLPIAAGLSGSYALVVLLVALFGIWPNYQAPAPLTSLPADAIPLNVRFDEGVQLVGYSTPNSVITPGQPLEITFYWQAVTPMDENVNLALTGYGLDLQPVAKLDTWPGGGWWPTQLWQPGLIYADPYLLATDVTAQSPTRLQIGVSFWQGQPENTLPLWIDDAPAEALLLNAGGLAHPIERPSGPGRVRAEFAHGLVLSDFEVLQKPNEIDVLTVWYARQAVIPADYTQFMHLLDANGALVGQADAPPGGLVWPTRFWRAGETITDYRTIVLPSDLPSGQYRIITGLYDPLLDQRLPVNAADGTPILEGVVELVTITLP